jgi:hypothetical protein
MTILGKILVVVNFVFSIVAFFLIIFVNAASTNWHSQSASFQKQLQVAQQNAETYKSEANAIREMEGKRAEKFSEALKVAEKERDANRAEAEANKQRYDKEVAQRKELDANRDTLTAELARRKNEVDQLNGLLAARDKKMLDLEKEKKDLRDRAVNSEIAARAEQERNQQLVNQLEQMTRDMQRLQTTGTGGAATAGRNPPPEEVEGLIKAIDPQSGYVTLSVGGDHGLARGNTLEAFRLGREPRYLGTLRIVEVRASESVARPTSGRTQLQVGDRVASSITNNRR